MGKGGEGPKYYQQYLCKFRGFGKHRFKGVFHQNEKKRLKFHQILSKRRDKLNQEVMQRTDIYKNRCHEKIVN